MSIKYASTPQLNYGNPTSAVDKIIARIPRGARPMSEAPPNTKIVVQDQDEKRHWAMENRGRYEKIRPDSDGHERMCGEAVINPVCWWIPQPKR
jgi:hypothetical protein